MLMVAGGLQGQLQNRVVTCRHILSQAFPAAPMCSLFADLSDTFSPGYKSVPPTFYSIPPNISVFTPNFSPLHSFSTHVLSSHAKMSLHLQTQALGFLHSGCLAQMLWCFCAL